MTDLECELCGNPASNQVTLKNGSWVYEPLENLLGDIPATDLDGMVCGKWSTSRLTIFVHSQQDVADAREVVDAYSQ